MKRPKVNGVISIVNQFGAKFELRAEIKDGVALHESIGFPSGGYSVSHVASGCSFIAHLPIRDAVEFFEAVRQLSDEVNSIVVDPVEATKAIQSQSPQVRNIKGGETHRFAKIRELYCQFKGKKVPA